MGLFSVFKQRESAKEAGPIGMHIKQDCVFAHSEKIGDAKLMRMESGAIYLVKLVDMNSDGISHGADDTGLRNLIWEILDLLEVGENSTNGDKEFRCPRYGAVFFTAAMCAQVISEKLLWEQINRTFIDKFFPEQNKGPRFLRG